MDIHNYFNKDQFINAYCTCDDGLIEQYGTVQFSSTFLTKLCIFNLNLKLLNRIFIQGIQQRELMHQACKYYNKGLPKQKTT